MESSLTRMKLTIGLRAVLVGLVVAGAVHAAEPPRPPNLIVILADDLGYGDVCAYACPLGGRTPHIDALAARGARFTQAYVTAAVCSPSRAGLLTGRYQQRFGHELNAGGVARAHRDGLGTPASERMLPAYLKERGYATGMVGKWHLGSTEALHPMSRGFDEFFGFLHGGNLYIEPLDREGVHFIERGADPATRMRNPVNPILRGREPVEEPEYLTDAFTREAISFIDRHHQEPFFLYLAYNAPHTPLQVTDRYYQRFPHIEDQARRIYAAMVSALDDGVGAVRAALARHGLDERTLVVFTSDNGCATYTEACSNEPLLGGKVTPFEGGTRVPFIASWQGAIAPGRVIDAPVSTLDLLPTALAMANAAPRPSLSFTLDGESLLPILRSDDAKPGRDSFVWRLGDHYAVRSGDWKLVRFHEHPPMLFDLAADPGERTNLASQHAGRVDELDSIYRAWAAQMAAPLWETRQDLWVPLQQILDGEPLKSVEGPGPGVLRFPI
ncbi:MAG TPA: sulfatase-like hydrolase/transferase [Thermoanaerobaculia bacterium]|nr:sulfatase-like hydrolase/transferase [Thermoanaerobaculia bacterium]